MEQEAAQLQLLERLRNQAAWLRLPRDIFEDVVQEAWLLALDYAAKTRKNLGDLSQTELRFRCLEAKRKVSTPYQEIFLGEEWFQSTSIDLPKSAEIVEFETKNDSRFKDRTNQLIWLLEAHPALRFTDYQRGIWDLMRHEGKHGWQTAYARQRVVSRQAVAKTVSVIKNKLRAAAALLCLAEGDIDYFFSRYGRQWRPRLLAKTLGDLFRPPLGVKVPPALVQFLLPAQKPILEKATRLLTDELRQLARSGLARPENLALGANLYHSADYMIFNSSDVRSFAEEISNQGTRLGPFFYILFTIAAKTMGPRYRMEDYVYWLKKRLGSNDKLGRSYADFHIAYYYGVPESERMKLLRLVGNTGFEIVDYSPIISRLYNNIKNSLYNTQPHFLDMNFLKLLLIKKYYPFNPTQLSPHSRYALKTIAEKALHSNEPLVVSGAGEILAAAKA